MNLRNESPTEYVETLRRYLKSGKLILPEGSEMVVSVDADGKLVSEVHQVSKTGDPVIRAEI